MKKKMFLMLAPVVVLGALFLLILTTLLGGNVSTNVSANAPKGVDDSQIVTANTIVARIKKDVPKATNNGLAAVLGCWQAESGLTAKRAEGDYLQYPVGAQGANDFQTYGNPIWCSVGGPDIYGPTSPYAGAIQHRGLGLGQYTNERNIALQNYAKQVKKPWYDLNTQLDYILNVDGDAATLKQIVQENADVTRTTTDFLNQYERGGGSGLSARIALAQAWANYLSNPNAGGSASTKGTIASLNALVGTKVGSGQCYALPNWYTQKISGITLVGMNASDIGSDNGAALTRAGWKVIAHPTAKDLTAGSIVCWTTGPYANLSYGHTGVINAVSGSNFTTYEQNVNGNQTVQMYSRTWDSSETYVIVPPSK